MTILIMWGLVNVLRKLGVTCQADILADTCIEKTAKELWVWVHYILGYAEEFRNKHRTNKINMDILHDILPCLGFIHRVGGTTTS